MASAGHHARPLGLLAALLLLFAAACQPSPTATPALDQAGPGAPLSLRGADGSRPNILVIDIDSLRADRVDHSRGGQRVAPTIAALAQGGVRFEQAFAQSGWTVPSLLTILTGRYPVLVEDGDPRLREIKPTVPAGQHSLPEILGYYGYHCAVFWGETVPRGLPTLWQGFDEVQREGPGLPTASEGYGQAALRWLRDEPPEPFFVLLHDMDLHHPRPRLDPEQVHRYIEYHPAYAAEMLDQLYPQLLAELGEAAAQDRVVAYYDAYLSAYDEVILAVLQELHRTGLDQRTLVVLTSNHGEELFEAGTVGHTHSYRESLIRVPLILSHPSLPAGRVVQTPVQGIDLAPTLLALAEVQPDASMHGRSLLPLLRDPPGDITRRPLFLSNIPGEGCYRKGQLKLSGGKRPIRGQARRPAQCKLYELFDLGRDPSESVDVCVERADQIVPMVEQLERWLDQRAAEAQGLTAPATDEATRTLMQERGYWSAETNPAQ